MRPLDRLFQWWRIQRVQPYLPPRARVLDIGCGDGGLFRALGDRISGGLGLDSDLAAPVESGAYRLIRGTFPGGVPPGTAPFDAITMMAVLEHVPLQEQPRVAAACHALLKPGGRLIITVPSPFVDHILHVLKFLPFLYEGHSLEQHYGYDVRRTPVVFASLRLMTARKFQLGLNNLFVFEKPA